MSRTTDRLEPMRVRRQIKAYRDEHLCSIYDAKAHVYYLAIQEALEVAHGWEDLKAVMLFQHNYRKEY